MIPKAIPNPNQGLPVLDSDRRDSPALALAGRGLGPAAAQRQRDYAVPRPSSSAAAERPELERTDIKHPYWWYFGHTDVRDEKVALFAERLPAGTYEYTYQMRASVAGEFQVLPAHAYQMYFPEVFGRSAGGRFTVEP